MQPVPARQNASAPGAVALAAAGLALLLALLLSACVYRPQEAAPVVKAALPAPAAPGCNETPGVRAALQSVANELQAQGMALRADCAGAGDAWVLRLRVLDGVKASEVVRGPLADGQAPDMGTPSGVRGDAAPIGASGFSPDVAHNRQWLRALMERHGFDNLPDAWWHFALRSSAAKAGVGAR